MSTKENRLCVNCGEEIKGRGKMFCNQSCNATYQNKPRIKNIKIEKKCLNCGCVTTNSKYCSLKCQQEYQQQQVFDAIENGDTTFDFRNYKRYLIHKHGEKCMDCGWGEQNQYSGKIPIELEHIDGDSNNNSLDNLKLLCPNCHSLTPTYKALNTGNGRHKRRERYKEGKSY